jgi:glutamate-1-semialdehyde 2,1-aminomutase
MQDYSTRLNRVIPGGAHTYSRGDDQFPSNAPQILERGEGAYVWDPEGRKYLDYGMALRAVTLGYSYPSVNEAAIREITLGNNLTRASLTELKAAELITELIPSVEMVKFGKNGSNATTAAVKIARAYTGRRYVCIPKQQPFFSFDDWFIGTTALTRGIALANVNVVIHCAARDNLMSANFCDLLLEFRQVNVTGTLRLAQQTVEAIMVRWE